MLLGKAFIEEWKNMIYNRFSLLLFFRIGLLFFLLLGISLTRLESKWFFSNLILGLLVIVLVLELIRFINRTNIDLVRLLQALQKNDFATHFQTNRSGRNFRKLYSTFNEVIERYQDTEMQREAQKEFLDIAVSQLNVGIIAHEIGGRILIFNNYAQKIVGTIAPKDWDILVLRKIPIVNILHQLPIGAPSIHTQQIGNPQQSLLLQATTFSLLQKQIRLYTIKDIKSHLDQKEIESWQKVIRVLTHEIMNSLTPVISLTELAETLLHDEKNTHPYAEDIQSAIGTAKDRAKGLLAFVKGYRQFLRVPVPNLAPIDLFTFIENLAQLLVDTFEKNNINFQLDLPPSSVSFPGDQYLLEQVFINLFTNAIEALAETKDPILQLHCSQGNNKLLFKLQDNGPGMTDDVFTQIFIPFYTTKEKGTGIGLSISKQIIQSHQGQLFVESEVGLGSSFFIELPLT